MRIFVQLLETIFVNIVHDLALQGISIFTLTGCIVVY